MRTLPPSRRRPGPNRRSCLATHPARPSRCGPRLACRSVTAGGVPAAELGKITAPVLILGGTNSPGWFQRSVAEQAAATPGARLEMLDGYDHNAPPEVITPILIEFFGAHR